MSEPATPSDSQTDLGLDSPPAAAQPTDWRADLPPDLRDNPVTKRIGSVQDLLKEHIGVQKLIGGEKIPAPQDNWGEAEWNAHFDRLGRPESAEGYEIDTSELPESFPLDEAMMGVVRKAAHAAGIPAKALGAVMGEVLKHQAEGYAAIQQQSAQQAAETDKALKTEWGASYGAKLDQANRAFKQVFGDQVDEIRNTVLADGTLLGNHPALIQAFAKVGGSMGEHALKTGDSTRFTMSPREALDELSKFQTENFAALSDPTHPEHALVTKKKQDLYDMAHPEAAA